MCGIHVDIFFVNFDLFLVAVGAVDMLMVGLFLCFLWMDQSVKLYALREFIISHD